MGWTFAVGPLFAFSLLGFTLQEKSHGGGVAALLLAGLVVLGSLSAQRRIRTRGAVNHWAFDELVLTIGYGLLAASMPLVVGMYGGVHELNGDPFPIGWTGVASLVALLCVIAVVLLVGKETKVTIRSESVVAVTSLVLTTIGVIVAVAVVVQGGLSGNQIRLFTFQGVPWHSVCAGVALAVPLFFGAEYSVTHSAELGDDAKRWSRPNVLWLIAFLVLLQYSGAIGTAVTWMDPPALSPLANTYLGGSARGVAWFSVVMSGLLYSVLLAVLFANRLAVHGASRLVRSVTVSVMLASTLLASMSIATDFRIDKSTGTYAALSVFLNVSSVGGALLVAGLAVGCLRAIFVTRSLKMGTVEYFPSIVGLLGLSLTFYGYFWRGVTSAPMARSELLTIVGGAIAVVALVSWRRTLRSSEVAQ
ncbi:MAG: hypothetical protein NTY27_04735 [Actinobacteria bacterium]|nr:hypothetical protein [Actinomycetota bacterium]